jgi:hypothetical protein
VEGKSYVRLFEGYYGPKWKSFIVMLYSGKIGVLREN